MDRFNRYRAPEEKWDFTNSTVIDYHHQPPPSRAAPPVWQASSTPDSKDDFNKKLFMQLQMLSGNIHQDQVLAMSRSEQGDCGKVEPVSSFDHWTPAMSTQESTPFPITYKSNPDSLEDMDISDDENTHQNTSKKTIANSIRTNIELTSGAGFYKGLILYIPPFEQLLNSYKGSPAVKMLYASFEFSFGIPCKITTTPRDNSPNVFDAGLDMRSPSRACG
uniref:Uncharacterized protein n=1 Tax=Graphocephala atropunctata TaxID=36148 RepID=A0A1B6MNJ4_9HEMI